MYWAFTETDNLHSELGQYGSGIGLNKEILTKATKCVDNQAMTSFRTYSRSSASYRSMVGTDMMAGVEFARSTPIKRTDSIVTATTTVSKPVIAN